VINNDNSTIASGVILYSTSNDGVKYLLLQSARHQTWGFAKGHVDGDETLIECALREVTEETGYVLGEGDVFEMFNDCASYKLPDSDILKRAIMFIAKGPVDEQEICPSDEHQKHIWCDLEAALELLQHRQSRICLLRAADWLKNK